MFHKNAVIFKEALINSGCVDMRFKIFNPKTASASNSTAIAKFANAGVGDFGRIGTIHCVDQHLPCYSCAETKAFLNRCTRKAGMTVYKNIF